MSPPRRETAIALALCAGLAALVLAVFAQTGRFAFVNWDDPANIAGNPAVAAGLSRDGLLSAFTFTRMSAWVPLVNLSYILDSALFGPEAGGYHLMNVLYHLLNTLLLFHVLRRMTGETWRSAAVAALFAAHPLHVEPVAWVSGRTDLLSTLFLLLTVLAYVRYAERPGIRYAPVVLLFLAGLLSKPVLVTLPFLLLLLDWWPLRRVAGGGASSPGAMPAGPGATSPARLLLEKVPLFAIAAVFSVLTWSVKEQEGTLIPAGALGLGARVSNALVSYVDYMAKTVWPSSLACFYPHPADALPAWKAAGAALVLAAFSAAAVREARRRPWLAVGWFWFLGTMVPMIGLVQVGSAAAADRYTYVPLTGLFLAAVWGVFEATPPRLRRVAAGALALVVAAFAAAGFVQTGYWRDSATLFARALAATDRNCLAWNNLGAEYNRMGRPAEAVEHYREALRINPNYADAWNNLGAACDRLGRLQEAEAAYLQALRLRPDFVEARTNLAVIYDKLGRRAEAVAAFREALRLRPDHAEAWNNLGVTYDKAGESAQAIACFREAARLKPDFAEAWNNLGVAHDNLGRSAEALAFFREAARIKPDFAEAWNNVGFIYDKLGRPDAALPCFREAARIRPDFAQAWNNLGVVYDKLGRPAQAAECYREAQRVAPR